MLHAVLLVEAIVPVRGYQAVPGAWCIGRVRVLWRRRGVARARAGSAALLKQEGVDASASVAPVQGVLREVPRPTVAARPPGHRAQDVVVGHGRHGEGGTC